MVSEKFVYVVCQKGSERACKAELAKNHPELRFAFSRPGFLTFRLAAVWPDSFLLRSTFSRTAGWSLGKITGEHSQALVESLLSMCPSDLSPSQIHVWERDAEVPGHRGFEPFPTELANTSAELIYDAWNQRQRTKIRPNLVAHANERVLDIVIVEPNVWWVGWHVANTIPGRWVGGVPKLERDDEIISRAYYKLSEAIEWSQFPIRKDDLVLELGSAPGGATARLLELGTHVFAIDPAELDPEIAEHPSVMHIQMRSKDVSKKEVKGCRWMVADLNVAPKYTLDAAEEFVKNQNLKFRGLVLTLKLTDWKLADELDGYRERVRSWGFDLVKTRQLAFNRQEICLVAVKDKMDIRKGQRKPTKRSRPTPDSSRQEKSNSKRSPANKTAKD